MDFAKHVRIAVAALPFAAAGCAAVEAEPIPRAAPAACAVSTGVPRDALDRAPSVVISPPPSGIRLTHSYTLTGACADDVQAFEMDHILFADGRVMAIGSDDSLSVVPQPTAAVQPSALGPDEAPRLGGAPLIYAAHVGALHHYPPVPSAYVGVWRTGGTWTVATFRLSADGRTSAPQPLLGSGLPILGLGYFPSPDAPTGQLGVVQRVSPGTARLLTYQWYHPGL